MPAVTKIPIPIILFRVPTKPFYQFLTVGRHVGNAAIEFPRRFQISLALQELLQPSHAILLMQKRRSHGKSLQLSGFEDLQVDPEMNEEAMGIIMQMCQEKSEWAIRCEAHNNGKTCRCVRDTESSSTICRCSQEIIPMPFDNLFSALFTVSSIINQTMDKTLIAQVHKDTGDHEVSFEYGGRSYAAFMLSSNRFPILAAIEDCSTGSVHSCRQFAEWTSFAACAYNEMSH